MSSPQPASTNHGSRLPFRHWITHHLGIDRAIAFTVLGRGWASLAGLITLSLIAHFLSPVEQGYYYVFGSLVALQVVFELGFSFVILQMASHERAHLIIANDGTVSGNPVSHARLASVLQKAVRWYTSAAAILAVFLISAGSWFFSTHQHMGEGAAWRLPWYATALCATVTFQLDPVLSFMEGCGFVSNIAKLRFFQAFTGSLLSWSALILHHGLFSPAMMIAGNALCAAVWLSTRRRFLIPLLRHAPGDDRIHWLREVWPFQWRIAVSWLCGIFIFQLYNPVLFAYWGPIAAGQMGMSLNMANAMQSVAVAWFNTKAAPFGGFIARREYDTLDRVFFRSTGQALGVITVGAVFVWSAVVFMNWKHVHFASRILPPLPLGLLFAATVLNVLTFAQALYLRAHKQEKFLIPSIIGAVLTGSSTYFLGRYYGSLGVTCGTFFLAVLVGLPMNTSIFLYFRRLWHGNQAQDGEFSGSFLERP